MPVHDFRLGIIISVEQSHGFGNFPRQTGCEGTERFISEQLTTTELVYGAPHMKKPQISFLEIWLLLLFPVCHGLVYPIRIGHAKWGFCPTYSCVVLLLFLDLPQLSYLHLYFG